MILRISTTRGDGSARLPRLPDALLQLVLTGLDPWRIVLLGNLYATVSQQDRNLIDGDAGEEEFDRECIPEHVRKTALPG